MPVVKPIRLILLAALVILLPVLFFLNRPVSTRAGQSISRFREVPAVTPLQDTAVIPGRTQASTNCQTAIFNPSLDYGYGWTVYADNVVMDDPNFATAPTAFHMLEDNDGVGSPLYGDIDSVGQVFNFPNNIHSFSLDFKIAYNSWSIGDDVKFDFAEVDSNGSLVNAIGTGTASKFIDNLWHAEQFNWDASTPWLSNLWGKPIALVFYTETDNQNIGSYALDVTIDDIQLKLCTSNYVPNGTINGVVNEEFGVNMSNAHILLTHTPLAGPLETIDVTFPQTNGTYAFENVEPLPPGDKYQVWYINDGTDANRLGLWAGPSIPTFANNQDLYNVNFDVKNIELTSPVHEAETVFPVTFSWTDRGVYTDQYYLCIYDTQTLDQVCTSNPVSGTEVTIYQSDLENVPGSNFNFEFNHRYAWSLTVVDGSNYASSSFANIGYSYSANAITFVAEQSLPPGATPPPNGLPPSGSTADWTVMFYIAGDNSLGDPARYFDPNYNLQGQFASLKDLARTYPNVNLVTLTDFYDDSGTEFCHLKPDGTQTCQQLGELDSANPAVLSDFINNSLASFPASHRMLVISDHGHSIAGVAADETTSRTATMTPDEIRQAFAAASLDVPGRKLDVLFFNACLMGSFEVAFDAQPYADYMVASADELWVLNVYDRMLPLLANPATKDVPRSVAAGIVTAYQQAVLAAAPDYFISSAAYDLQKVTAVNTALSNLASVLGNELGTSRNTIENIRNQVQVYDSSGNYTLGREDAFVDLWDLGNRLRDYSGNTAITNAAVSLLNAVGPVGGSNSLIIASQQISGDNSLGTNHDLTNAAGLSVFFPNGQSSGEQPTLTNQYLNRGIYQTYIGQTEWDEFLRMYVSNVLNSGPVRLQSGTRPIGGEMAISAEIYIPLISNQ